MPRSEKLNQLLEQSHGTENQYSFHKVEGTPALIRNDIYGGDELVVGNKVNVFNLPDGKHFISKADLEDATAFTVGRITSSYIYFDDEITLEEK